MRPESTSERGGRPAWSLSVALLGALGAAACSAGAQRTEQAPSAGAVSVQQFGARCDGRADDAPAIRSAEAYLERRGGGTLLFPAGKTCLFRTSLTIRGNGIGWASDGVGYAHARLECATGSQDCLDIGNGSSQLYYTKLQGLYFQGSGLTGGWMFNVNGAALLKVQDVVFNGVFNGVKTNWVNAAEFDSVRVVATSAGGSTLIELSSPASDRYRSDVVTWNDSTAEANDKGRDCMVMDGDVNTVRLKHVALLNCRLGFHVLNSAGGRAYYPQFVFATDLEVDGNTAGGVLIDAGADFSFVNSDIDDNSPSTNAVPFRANPDLGRSYTRGIRIVGSNIHDGPRQAAIINARGVIISGSNFFDTNHLGKGTYPALEIGPDSDDVVIGDSSVAQRYGEPAAPKYGLQLDKGAAHVALGAMDYRGATVRSINNLSSSPVELDGVQYDGTTAIAQSCGPTTAC